MNEVRPILLVEDDAQDEMLILRSLGKVNLANQVDVVRDGQQALDYLFHEGEYAESGHASPPAVVLLDLNLPRIGGLEVLKRIRTDPRTCLIPVAILTSSDEEKDRLASYVSGANSFVRKPLDLAEFAETVSHMGIYWAMLNETPDEAQP